MKTKIQLALILLTVTDVLSDTDYCALKSCPNESHTLCMYEQAGISHNCGRTIDFHLGRDHINTIVKKHDKMARTPLHVRTPQHSGESDKFQWDTELAIIAQRWAEQCEKGSDTCRHVERFNVTQRIGKHELFKDEGVPSIGTIIDNWHLEDLEYSLQTLRLGRFHHTWTWRYTRYIGCGAIKKVRGDLVKLWLVCNYAPV